MGKMGQYCKAYPLSAMRQFDGWHENAAAFRKAAESANGDRPHNDHIVYLQENYVVTDGIFIDENVIFDEVTDPWIEFCKTTLDFEMPADAVAMAEQTKTANA
jgi:hypothetical protein